MPAPAAPVSFYFDPICPWTWNTSRWLVDVAGERGFAITWRTFSLAIVNEGNDVPEQYARMHVVGQRALRVVEALRAQVRNDDIARLYTELGRAFFHDGDEVTAESFDKVVSAAGLAEVAGAADDESWDEALRASIAEARELVGTDVGSPIVKVADQAMFGPIVSPPPVGIAATELWDAVTTLIAAEGVYEVKRSRTGGPATGARP